MRMVEWSGVTSRSAEKHVLRMRDEQSNRSRTADRNGGNEREKELDSTQYELHSVRYDLTRRVYFAFLNVFFGTWVTWGFGEYDGGMLFEFESNLDLRVRRRSFKVKENRDAHARKELSLNSIEILLLHTHTHFNSNSTHHTRTCLQLPYFT